MGQRRVCVTGDLTKYHFHCAIYVVYTLNESRERKYTWGQLRALKGSLSAPLLLMEDFNEVLLPKKRRGANQVLLSMREFQDFMHDT